MMSSLLAPAATIGKTFSSASVRKSMTTGTSLIEFAWSMTSCISLSVRARRPTQPMASAHFT